jgi:hypothetical protein
MTPIDPGDVFLVPFPYIGITTKKPARYLSVGDPRPAIGIDIGEGLVVRFNEAEQSVVGLNHDRPAGADSKSLLFDLVIATPPTGRLTGWCMRCMG